MSDHLDFLDMFDAKWRKLDSGTMFLYENPNMDVERARTTKD